MSPSKRHLDSETELRVPSGTYSKLFLIALAETPDVGRTPAEIFRSLAEKRPQLELETKRVYYGLKKAIRSLRPHYAELAGPARGGSRSKLTPRGLACALKIKKVFDRQGMEPFFRIGCEEATDEISSEQHNAVQAASAVASPSNVISNETQNMVTDPPTDARQALYAGMPFQQQQANCNRSAFSTVVRLGNNVVKPTERGAPLEGTTLVRLVNQTDIPVLPGAQHASLLPPVQSYVPPVTNAIPYYIINRKQDHGVGTSGTNSFSTSGAAEAYVNSNTLGVMDNLVTDILNGDSASVTHRTTAI